MKLVNMEELKEKLDRGDNLLVNAVGEGAFNPENIPGSINISKIEEDAGSIIILILIPGIEPQVLQTTFVLVTNCN